MMNISICLSVSVCTHNSKTVRSNFTKFLYILPVAMVHSFFDGIAICYELPVLRMMSCFHTMELMGMELCSLPAPVNLAAGQARAPAAHWLTGLVCRLARAR